MKPSPRLHFLIILVLLTGQILAQDPLESIQPEEEKAKRESHFGFGIVFKASTNGIGADLVYRFGKRLDLRLGYDTASLTINEQITNDDIQLDVNATLDTGTLSALLNYYLGKRFFISAGLMSNNFLTVAEGKLSEDYLWGDILISQDDFGKVQFTLEPTYEIAPYFGIGFGEALSQKRRVSLALEFGALYFGQPDITINSTGALSPTSDPFNGQEKLLERELEPFVFYPVIKLSLGIKLSKQK